MNIVTRHLFALMLLCFTSVTLSAERVNTLKPGLFGDRVTEIAIRGYDSVAYFTEQRAVVGRDEFSYQWQGARWLFSSADHRDRFAANPEAYAPQFGGYCAYGVAQGELLRIEGEQWAVVDGRLYLNYDAKWFAKWQSNRDHLIALAEMQYPSLIDGQ